MQFLWIRKTLSHYSSISDKNQDHFKIVDKIWWLFCRSRSSSMHSLTDTVFTGKPQTTASYACSSSGSQTLSSSMQRRTAVHRAKKAHDVIAETPTQLLQISSIAGIKHSHSPNGYINLRFVSEHRLITNFFKETDDRWSCRWTLFFFLSFFFPSLSLATKMRNGGGSFILFDRVLLVYLDAYLVHELD